MMSNALLVVPHQDDETNLAGNIIDVIKEKYDLFILYSSLDTRPEKGKVRKQEAINACAVWDIPQDHLIFLDYPDTPNKIGHHWYTDGDYMIVEDLKKWILHLQPEIIMATDFDFHSDHRMLSIAFDNAMGQILKENHSFRPLVLKGFCYETAFYGEKDYKASNPGTSSSNSDPLSNPSYEWEKRVSIHSDERVGLIWKRKAYKALAKHKSQYCVLHARSIINSDNVFWTRRTDNLLYEASLSGSVDGIEKIRDFVVLDTDDIITHDPRKINYEKSIVRFEKGDYIKAEWDKSVSVDRIILHGSINHNETIRINILATVNGEKKYEITELKPYGRETPLYINCSVKQLSIRFESGPVELSEIEVLMGDISYPFEDISNQPMIGIVDLIDKIGYKLIEIFTRVRRKIQNTIHI